MEQFPELTFHLAHIAFSFEHILREMLEKGLDPNIVDPNSDETLLFKACTYNCLDIIEILLRYGADPNKPCPKNGQLCLYYSTKWSSLESMKKLLRYGADPNGVDPESGEFPLYIASKCNRIDKARLLLKKTVTWQFLFCCCVRELENHESLLNKSYFPLDMFKLIGKEMLLCTNKNQINQRDGKTSLDVALIQTDYRMCADIGPIVELLSWKE